MSEEIFLGLFERALTLDPEFPIDFEPRWIKRFSDEDAELMARADVFPLRLSRRNVSALLTFEDDKYFGVTGVPEPETIPPDLIAVDTTPGLFSSFAVSTSLKCDATAARIMDVLQGQHGQIDDYDGHDFEMILDLFPSVRFYRVDQGAPYTDSVERVLGSYVARGYVDGPLHLSEETLRRFSNLFETGPGTIPFALPLQGLLSFSWAGLFLELYRCIEQLYSVPRLVKLTREWTSERSFHELSELIENTLAWRAKEDEALEALLSEVDVALCSSLRDTIGNPALVEKSSPSKSAARRVYSLRNACVHYRPATKLDPLSDGQWNTIASILLLVVEDLYIRHGHRMHAPGRVEVGP